MPTEGLQFRGQIGAVIPVMPYGKFVYPEFAKGLPGESALLDFECVTGSTSGPSVVADITYNSTTTVLVPSSYCPLNMRPYVKDLSIRVQGKTSWTGGTGIYISDTNGYPCAWIPAAALRASGTVEFPANGDYIALYATASSYNSSTGVITFPANTFITTTYSGNCPFRVVAGTGAGQTGIIASNTATAITPATILATALDSTSVIEVPYWVVTGSPTSTTTPISNAAFTVNALDNGYSVVGIAGTIGQTQRPILSNTATTPTVTSAFNTTAAAGDLIEITTQNELHGAIDLAIGDFQPFASINSGIQVTVVGTFTGGSPLRIEVEGGYAF